MAFIIVAEVVVAVDVLYLGHRNIHNTVCYTELAPGRFKGLFSD